MPSIRVTFNTPASGPFQLAALFSSTPPAGVTVVPAAPLQVPRIVQYLNVQSDPANGANLVYTGDANLTPKTAEIGMSLAAGQSDNRDPVCGSDLNSIYVNASAATAIANITAEGRF